MSERQEGTIGKSLKFTGSVYRILLADISLKEQLKLKEFLCCEKYHQKVYINSTMLFPYFLVYHYFSVDLQKKDTNTSEFFLEFICLKFDSKQK